MQIPMSKYLSDLSIGNRFRGSDTDSVLELLRIRGRAGLLWE